MIIEWKPVFLSGRDFPEDLWCRRFAVSVASAPHHICLPMEDPVPPTVPADPGLASEEIDRFCTDLVVEAGELALGRFRTGLAAEDKGGHHGYDPVTEADRSTEAFLRRRIAARFPDAEILGEENGSTGSGRMRWVIDPIDGTRAFVTGMPLWGVLLGLQDDGRAVAGWVRMPALGETFAAIGAVPRMESRVGTTTLRTSGVTNLATATMYTTDPAMFPGDRLGRAFAALGSAVRLQRYGGDCYSYCMLAAGHVDLVVENGLQPYDIAALIPIVESAGGMITGPDGESAVEGGLVVASASAALHHQALEVLHDHLVMPVGGSHE